MNSSISHIRTGVRWMFVFIGTLILTAAAPEKAAVTLHLIGDSTMADKPPANNPERGWGQLFGMFFGDDISIVNHAKNGRSTKSFIDEGRWDVVSSKLKAGDYVFIQFGHNDGKVSDSTRYAAARPTYKNDLIRFVRETRDRGATPILLTPVTRRKFDSAGKLVNTHGEYLAVVKEVVAEEKVAFIDLQAASAELVSALGPEESKRLFLWVEPGRYALHPNGKEDNTHFRARGAFEMAKIVAEAVKRLDVPLAASVRMPAEQDANRVGTTVLLDTYFNNEWRAARKKDSLERFHYVWEDTTNSGFSAIGSAITRLGANIESIEAAPSAELLDRADVYVIVDPDTRLETKDPKYMTAEYADVIETWVKKGGVLLLLANDKGNCDLEHFNILAKRFGMSFNEDSHHPVVGKQFETGAFTDLPDLPIFFGVKKIFMKEIASISISEEAEAVLEEDGKTFIACAKIGQGMVLAVGDPWLYNEYVDGRKLPEEYQNAKAGRNLFAKLLSQSAGKR